MIHVVVGTKAQLIKIAPVMAALQRQGVDYNFIFTGQHRETIADLRQNFGIKEPDVVLYHGKDITSIIQMLFWMSRILLTAVFHRQWIFRKQGKKDIVLVHGDTFSTLLGALMGKMAGKKIGHVESGLRSFKLFHPFPEEITRLLTFYLSDYYFCPGDWAMQNLAKYRGHKINTGANTLLDALGLAKDRLNVCSVKMPEKPFALVSLHRFENIFKQKTFKILIEYLQEISQGMKLLFIMHPPTAAKLEKFGFHKKMVAAANIELRPRYDYFNFIQLLIGSEFLITDGGSNQEEASYLGKPTLLFRSATERKEGIGANVVVSNYDRKIINEFVANYKQYATLPVRPEKSPTEIIISNITQFE